jgi:hypothetical protein
MSISTAHFFTNRFTNRFTNPGIENFLSQIREVCTIKFSIMDPIVGTDQTSETFRASLFKAFVTKCPTKYQDREKLPVKKKPP